MKRFFNVILVLVIAALLFPLSNLLRSGKVDAALSAKVTDPHLQKLTPVYQQKCLDCHSRDAELPFYARFPIAKDLIEKDRKEALAHFDMMERIFGEGSAVSEVALAEMQQVVQDGSMPPANYKALHWNAGMTKQEKSDTMAWARTARARANASGNPDDPIYAEALLPLVPVARLNPEKVALGRKLYHDTRLSTDNTLSCASCHDLAKGGTDQAPVSDGVGGQKGPINSPTVFNAVYGLAQFWDGRAKDLKEQAAGPINNPIEMGSNWEEVLGKLKDDKEYQAAFASLYPEGMSGDSITDAIAEFEKTLVTPNSRFDQYLRGDADAMTSEEKEGYRLFRSYGCQTCHVGQAMGGKSFEKMGRLADYFGDRGNVKDADYGHANFTKKDADRFKFKVPTLRNAALTFPYFHDASATDLQQAIRAMAKYQSGKPITENEVHLVMLFLETLTGEYEGQRLK